jgi:predicted GIY-YIG superfamily endonuclease
MVLNKEYVVYIMASSTGTLYIGMTGFFFTRVGHQQILAESCRVRTNIL